MNGRITIDAGGRCSFGVPLVLLRSSLADTEDTRWHDGDLTLFSRICNGDLTEMSRKSRGDLTEVYASGNLCSCGKEEDFESLRTYVHGLKNVGSFSKTMIC